MVSAPKTKHSSLWGRDAQLGSASIVFCYISYPAKYWRQSIKQEVGTISTLKELPLWSETDREAGSLKDNWFLLLLSHFGDAWIFMGSERGSIILGTAASPSDHPQSTIYWWPQAEHLASWSLFPWIQKTGEIVIYFMEYLLRIKW